MIAAAHVSCANGRKGSIGCFFLGFRADHFATENRKPIVEFAALQRVTAVYPWPFFVSIGGLISHGPNQIDIFRRAASFLDRILKGAKPGDLPFELAMNIKDSTDLITAFPPVAIIIAVHRASSSSENWPKWNAGVF